MLRLVRCAAALSLAAVLGCQLDSPGAADPPEPVRAAASALGVPPTAVAGRRWIVAELPSDCVSTPDFNAEPLFPALHGVSPLPEYCLYTWARSGLPTAAEIESWSSSLTSSDFAEDSAIVVPLSQVNPYSTVLPTFMRTAIERRIGTVTAAPRLPLLARTHVAVLDTSPDASTWTAFTGSNPHGAIVSALIADLAETPGAAQVSTTLAMPLRLAPSSSSDTIVDTTRGGDFGHISDVAHALWAALSDHEYNHAGQKLVINLSLGWAPRSGDETASAPLTDARAVRDMLNRAACEDGALVVAAAGNDMGGPAPAGGLMFPAAWTATSTSCDSEAPLVVAAYGLDYGDRPIALARPQSAVPLAAPAVYGVAWAGAATPPEPLTGTSIAAAAVSAAAAVVWAADGTQSAKDVTRRLYDWAQPVSPMSNVVTVGLSPGDMRRVSICGALAPFAGWTCQSSAPILNTSTPPLDNSTALAFSTLFPQPPADALASSNVLLPVSLAPMPGGQNLVFPQPFTYTCSKCGIVALPDPSEGVMYGEFTQGRSSPVLVVQGSSSVAYYSLSDVASAGIPFSQRIALPQGARSAWVSSIETASNLSAQQQIFVSHVTP